MISAYSSVFMMVLCGATQHSQIWCKCCSVQPAALLQVIQVTQSLEKFGHYHITE